MYPAPPPPRPPLSAASLSHTIFHTHHLSHTTLSHTIFDTQLCHTTLCHTPSFTHNFVTHHLSHTTLSHTIFDTPLCHTSLSHTIFHTPLCHTPSLTHHFVTHHLSHRNLSHSSLSHTIFHTQLCHSPSFTYTIFHTQLCHTSSSSTPLSHTIFDTPLCHTSSSSTPLSHTTLPHTIFAWQAWSTPCLRGRRGTCHWAGSGGVLGARWSFGAVRHFAWQAWHLVLRGAGVALGDMHLRFAWQACTDGTGLGLVARLGARWSPGATALGRVWWLVAWAQAWHLATSTCTLHGRCSTYGTWRAWACWLGGARGTFAWQARHLATSDMKSGSFGGGDENMQWAPKWDHYSLGPFLAE